MGQNEHDDRADHDTCSAYDDDAEACPSDDEEPSDDGPSVEGASPEEASCVHDHQRGTCQASCLDRWEEQCCRSSRQRQHFHEEPWAHSEEEQSNEAACSKG